MRGALRSVAVLFMAAFLSLGVAPRASIYITTLPNFPNLGQVVTVMVRMEHPLPDKVCVDYVLNELGDRTPEERGYVLGPWPVPIYRLSCRTPEFKLETFRWDRLIDGKYTVTGWTVRNSVIESRPLPKEMVVR